MCRWKYGKLETITNFLNLKQKQPFRASEAFGNCNTIQLQNREQVTYFKLWLYKTSCCILWFSCLYNSIQIQKTPQFKSVHSKQETNYDLHITEKKKTSQVKQLLPQSLLYKNSTRNWDSILSEHLKIKSTSSHIHSNILHVTIKTFTRIWAPKIKSVASVLSNTTILTTQFLSLCFDILSISVLTRVHPRDICLVPLLLNNMGRYYVIRSHFLVPWMN